MSKFKFELNSSGVGELLKSQAMHSVVKGKADGIRARCGEGYGADVYAAGTRVIASVWADTKEARKDNLENNSLLKAVR